jgi:hypothetical protein
MATRAEIAGAGRAHAVLAYPVTVMHEVAGRERVLGLEIDVAAVAVSEVPLILMLVASETGCHLGAKLGRLLVGNSDMAPHAVSLHVRHVALVLEAKVLTRKLCTLAHEGLAMTGAARILVVGLGVAAAADRVGREVDGARVACERNSFVAHDAVDSTGHVRAMLEGMGLRHLLETEHARASGEGKREDQEKASREHPGQQTGLHRISRVRDRRRSALVS